MKLIGSKTEQDYREELLASHDFHFSEKSKSRLNEVLRQAGYKTENAYVLHWTPDQSDDLFTVLVDGAFLVSVQIDRDESEGTPSIEQHELVDYLKGLSRLYRVQLLVAQELAKEKT